MEALKLFLYEKSGLTLNFSVTEHECLGAWFAGAEIDWSSAAASA